MSDTIFAQATPPGKGGVAIIRVSGPMALESLALLTGQPVPAPRLATLRWLRNPVSRETIDQAMVIAFAAPGSFTGEDVAEFHLHGGVALVDALLAALAEIAGCRLAEPGEFTRRAFENGKLDLTEAEAIADLIDAETALQKAQALSQFGGALSALYGGWTERLTRALAYLEAELEFPDEDLPEGVAPQVMPMIKELAGEIAAHLDDNRRGERMREGIQIAVIGAPNAGKSSLVNALAKRDVAIVSDHAGTTRDIIEVHLDLGGYPVTVCDTAGLRPGQLGGGAQEAIESEGIRRALERARRADIRLLLFDAAALPAMDAQTLALRDETALVVFNKVDKLADKPVDGIVDNALLVSASTGAGLPALERALIEKAGRLIGGRETPALSRARHRKALESCRESLERALSAPLPELMAEDVRLAIRALGRITGRVDVEDLLDVIFRDFCIGK